MSDDTAPFLETFPALSAIPGLLHGFVLRHPAVDVGAERDIALERLRPLHATTLAESLGIELSETWFGEQVHDCRIALCAPSAATNRLWPETDGLIAPAPGTFLGIHVADCCAVYVVDPVRRGCALLHSGKKGTELGIAPLAIARMREILDSDPADLIVQLSPCIRPPAYEIDFAARIRSDCAAAGVPSDQIHDTGACTSRDPDRYYSYRAEKGRTGRHLAVLGWKR